MTKVVDRIVVAVNSGLQARWPSTGLPRVWPVGWTERPGERSGVVVVTVHVVVEAELAAEIRADVEPGEVVGGEVPP